MVTCDYGGGFGNRMFQYIFARLFADKLKLALKSHPGKDITDVIKLTGQPEYKEYEKIKHTINDHFTYDDILKRDHEDCGYHLIGYFQHAEYYLENRNLIRSYFIYNPPTELDKKNIVAHIRLGDYKVYGKNGNILHPDYYLNILKREKYDKLFIVTDEPEWKEYFDYFNGINYEIISDTNNAVRLPNKTAQDFYYLMKFDRIIIGNSSFSWWAAFLSNASKIYTPLCWIRYMSDAKCNLHLIQNGIPVKAKYYNTPIISKYKKLSFIICMNAIRANQLPGCIENINNIYHDINREIIIVEQDTKEPFKRGQLFNLGYKESSGDLVIFQDVDVRYISKIDFDYHMQIINNPYCPWIYIAQLRETENGYTITKTDMRQFGYGAANVFTREQFEKCNGFSNLYIGWGGEDNEMNARARFEKVNCTIGHIEHERAAYSGSRNVIISRTFKNRDIKKDGLEQTIFKKREVAPSFGYRHFKYTGIDICELFVYKDLLEMDDAKIITNVRKQYNTHIPIGILTHNRAGYFKGTIASLNQTLSIDKKKLYIFDDGSTEPEHADIIERLKKETNVIEFGRVHKTFKATKKAIEYMYLNNKDNELILCQDDIMFSKDWYYNAMIIIESMYRAGLDWGILSLYNLHFPSARPYTVIQSGHSGAVCLVISRAFWTEYRKENSIDDGRECCLADFLLAHYCQTHEKRQFAVCVTGKSLVQHIGVKSSLSDRDMTDCITPHFVG
jgi:hypothetical protein